MPRNTAEETPCTLKRCAGALSRSGRIYYCTGILTVLLLLGFTLLLYYRQGSFHREWINPFSVTGSGSFSILHPANLAVALTGTIGIPPFAVYTTFTLMLFGWSLLLHGLRRSGPLLTGAVLTLPAVQLWLLGGTVSGNGVLLPAVFWISHLLLYIIEKKVPAENRHLSAATALLHGAVTVGCGIILLLTTPDRMQLTLGVSAAQLFTVVLLICYWFLLGYDALDGSIATGKKTGDLGRRYLAPKVFTRLVFITLLLGTVYFFLNGGILIPFGVALLSGTAFYYFSARRGKIAFEYSAGNLLVFFMLLAVVLMQGLAVFFPEAELIRIELFIPPLVFYAVMSVWGFLSSGPLFVCHETRSAGRGQRLFLHLGGVLLATNCLAFFVAARDDSFMILADTISAEALLAVGIPVLLWLLFHKKEKVFHPAGKTPPFLLKLRQRWLPRFVFTLLAFAILAIIHTTVGLSAWKYTRVTLKLAEGNIALRQGELQQAVRAYSAVTNLQPENFKPYYMLGTVLQKQGRRSRALRMLEQAVQLAPDAVDCWLMLGALEREQKNYPRALQAYRRAAQLDPSDSFSYRNLGLCEAYLGNYTAAVSNLQLALRIMPGPNEFGNTHYPALGLVYIKSKQYGKAVKALRTALRFNSNDHLALSDLGVIHARRGETRQAVNMLERAHRIRPDKRDLLDQLLSQLQKTGDRQRAARALGRTAKARPDDYEINLRYIKALLGLELFQHAARELPERLRRFPRSAPIQVCQAQVDLHYRRYNAAMGRLNRALRLSPVNSDALTQRAWLHRLQKNYPAAFKDYKTILQRVPRQRNALLFGGIIAVRNLQNFADGFQMLDRVLKGDLRRIKPGMLELALRYCGLAAVRIKPPKIEAGIRCYRRLLKIKPDDFGALQNLNIIYGATRRYSEQIPVLQRLKRLRPEQLIYRIQLGMGLEKTGEKKQAQTEYSNLHQLIKKTSESVYNRRYRQNLKGFPRNQILAFLQSKLPVTTENTNARSGGNTQPENGNSETPENAGPSSDSNSRPGSTEATDSAAPRGSTNRNPLP